MERKSIRLDKAEIVVSTVQSFISKNKYRKILNQTILIWLYQIKHTDHWEQEERVFEYFIGFKLGLTATPKDYLKSINIDEISESDPRQLEKS